MNKEEYDRLIDDVNILCRRCVNHEMCLGTGCSPRNELVELIDKVMEALEKQIPKKPKIKQDRDRESTFWYCCPVCDEPLNIKCGCQNNDCRQAIDWSEEE